MEASPSYINWVIIGLGVMDSRLHPGFARANIGSC
jgi:hypothetical protein